jgi:hypothetical protein
MGEAKSTLAPEAPLTKAKQQKAANWGIALTKRGRR